MEKNYFLAKWLNGEITEETLMEHVSEDEIRAYKKIISATNQLESPSFDAQENLEKIKFENMYFNNCNGNIFVENNANNEDLENWYGNSAFFNVYAKSFNSETFIDLNNERRPDFRLRINKIIATNDLDPDLRID